MTDEPTEGMYHDTERFDPRGPDFDAPHTPEREARMRAKAVREMGTTLPSLPEPCSVCGEVHEPE